MYLLVYSCIIFLWIQFHINIVSWYVNDYILNFLFVNRVLQILFDSCWLILTLNSSGAPFGLYYACLLAFCHSNVQPTTLSLSFWTSSCLFTASPPLQRPTCHSMPLPFGLPRAFPPLQRPIRPPCRTLLDFILPIYCLPTASTSNPPLYAEVVI